MLRKCGSAPAVLPHLQGDSGIGGRRMTDTENYIVFDRTGTPQVVVAVKTEIGGVCPQSGNREVEL